MARYLYSIVRCVPEPRTGEFVNIAAIAGDPQTGDWDIRQVENESRARRLANSTALSSVHGFLASVGEDIDLQLERLEEDGEPLGSDWLDRLANESLNVVQLSPPMPILAKDATEALDVVFEHMIIDPESRPREFVTKHTVISALRSAYNDHVQPELVRPRVDLFAGDRVHTPIDFAIANGRAFQICQGWTFQKMGVDEISTQVKAWGYALRRVRDGEEARIIAADNHVSTIDKDVELEVLVALPKTNEQQQVFEEATQVFNEVGAVVRALRDAEQVAVRAAELVGASQ